MDLQYQRNTRGTFNFTGSATANSAIVAVLPAGATPYSSDTTVTSDIKAMADYLAGFVATSSFTQGVLRRSIYQNTFSLFTQDQYQAMPNLTLNYGLRYDYNAPFNSPGVLSDFRPGGAGADPFGLVIAGNQIGSIYPGNKTNLAPRFRQLKSGSFKERMESSSMRSTSTASSTTVQAMEAQWERRRIRPEPRRW
jgi:hypothetical protein